MNEPMEKKIKNTKVDRIALVGESSTRVNDWMTQLQEQFQGIRVKRNDLVEWLILNRSAELNPEEVRELGRKYYDEMDLANWAIRQLKSARSKGENTSLESILKSLKTKVKI